MRMSECAERVADLVRPDRPGSRRRSTLRTTRHAEPLQRGRDLQRVRVDAVGPSISEPMAMMEADVVILSVAKNQWSISEK